jgi:hypothetical protein
MTVSKEEYFTIEFLEKVVAVLHCPGDYKDIDRKTTTKAVGVSEESLERRVT